MVITVRTETLEEKKARVANVVAYKFRNPSDLSEAQLTDPDYSAEVLFGADYKYKVCSKCHHCR